LSGRSLADGGSTSAANRRRSERSLLGAVPTHRRGPLPASADSITASNLGRAICDRPRSILESFAGFRVSEMSAVVAPASPTRLHSRWRAWRCLRPSPAGSSKSPATRLTAPRRTPPGRRRPRRGGASDLHPRAGRCKGSSVPPLERSRGGRRRGGGNNHAAKPVSTPRSSGGTNSARFKRPAVCSGAMDQNRPMGFGALKEPTSPRFHEGDAANFRSGWEVAADLLGEAAVAGDPGTARRCDLLGKRPATSVPARQRRYKPT